MLVLSNNLIGRMPIPLNAVIRINLAWIKTVSEAHKIISSSKHKIYLDYPCGRTKPPKPTISLMEAIGLTCDKNVQYFAVSNVEDADTVIALQEVAEAEIVPKIETIEGVNNLDKIIKTGVKKIMIDKDDLYIDAGCDSKKYQKLMAKIDKYKDKVDFLTLQGVVFYG